MACCPSPIDVAFVRGVPFAYRSRYTLMSISYRQGEINFLIVINYLFYSVYVVLFKTVQFTVVALRGHREIV
jgi:hypothetical protein